MLDQIKANLPLYPDPSRREEAGRHNRRLFARSAFITVIFGGVVKRPEIS